MSKLIWNEIGSRHYEAGVDRGVFYPPAGKGVPWNGLISVRETPSGTGKDERYFDGEKYYVETTSDVFSGSIEAYTYPDEFEPYDGLDARHISHQKRKPFNLSYRTTAGNDLGADAYTIHLVYNVLVEPSERVYSATSDSIEPTTFSWDFTTLPVHIPGAKPASHLMLSTRNSYSWTLSALESIIYGSDGHNPRFPSAAEVLELTESNAILRVIDHGDGTWTAIGSDDMIQLLGDDTFQISSPSAVYLTEDIYRLESL